MRASFTAVAAACASAAHAHGERAADWRFDPLGIALLALLAIVYGVGQWRLRESRQSAARGAAFWTGWLALAIALSPPLENVTGVSFAAHMAQHEIMMLIAAPFLVAARPLGALLWGLPRAFAAVVQAPVLRRASIWAAAPVAAWLIHAVILWAWHVPFAFEAAVGNEAVHWLQHITFFLSAVIFWWSVFGAGRGERRGIAVVSLFTTAVHTTVLGTLLTFSTRVWYAPYAAGGAFGLSALEDQQLGGLIMWVPGGTVFVIAGVAVTARWLKELELRADRG